MARLPEFDWTLISMPARHFSWRIRANSLWLAGQIPRRPRFDLIIATSMTDLSYLAMRRELAATPRLVYFHENQFAYANAEIDLDICLLQVKTALAADKLVFNTRYNQDSFTAGARDFFLQFPDFPPAGVEQEITHKSSVLPVPIEVQRTDKARLPEKRRILWNHRWEHDKGPELLLAILDDLESSGFDFELVLCGQRFRAIPEALQVVLRRHAEKIVLNEFIEDANAYHAAMRGCGIVLSTALHDFQGLSILEAAALGCIPVVPDRLAYREYVPNRFRYACGRDDRLVEARGAASKIIAVANGELTAEGLGEAIFSEFGWPSWQRRYRELIESMIS